MEVVNMDMVIMDIMAEVVLFGWVVARKNGKNIGDNNGKKVHSSSVID